MPKINDYPDKINSAVVPAVDAFILTDGTTEYNLTVDELLLVHTTAIDHISTIVDLTDVNATGVSAGDILSYPGGGNAPNWLPLTPQLNMLSDVDIDAMSVVDGDLMTYVAANTQWEILTRADLKNYMFADGINGSFTADGNTYTITNGLITSVV